MSFLSIPFRFPVAFLSPSFSLFKIFFHNPPSLSPFFTFPFFIFLFVHNFPPCVAAHILSVRIFLFLGLSTYSQVIRRFPFWFYHPETLSKEKCESETVCSESVFFFYSKFRIWIRCLIRILRLKHILNYKTHQLILAKSSYRFYWWHWLSSVDYWKVFRLKTNFSLTISVLDPDLSNYSGSESKFVILVNADPNPQHWLVREGWTNGRPVW